MSDKVFIFHIKLVAAEWFKKSNSKQGWYITVGIFSKTAGTMYFDVF